MSAIAAHAISDTPFWQEYAEKYPLSTPAENDVRAVAIDSAGRLWAATGAGVRVLVADRWVAPQGAREIGTGCCLCPASDGAMWVGAWNGLYRATDRAVSPAGIRGVPIGALCRDPASTGAVIAAGPSGIWRGLPGAWRRLAGTWNTAIRAIAPESALRLWIGTASGLYLADLSARHAPSVRFSKPGVLLSSNISGLTRLPDGGVCIASTGGLDVYRGTRRVRSISVRNGLPCRYVRQAALDGDGRLWLATSLGVCRRDAGRWAVRHSLRWLPDDDARSMAMGDDGTAWVATGSGVGAIRRRRMTLEAKAAFFLAMLRARHVRPPGLVGPAVLDTPGDLSHSFIEDDDNDGQHTGEYCAMESMRYAVTHAPDARANACAAFHALLVLQRATGTHGFIARSVLPAGTAPRHETDRTFTPEQIAETHRTDPREKIIERRWLPSADGEWLWKRDTSSDEVDGHMFGYLAYYRFAADAGERRLVADEVDRLIGGIVDAGFTLRDVDGKPTRWGNWSPASLNGDPNWHEERSFNSAEMLSYLGVAFAVTGRARYIDAARLLVRRYGYARNMLDVRQDTPSEATHIEYELGSFVYPNLLTCVPLGSLRPVARQSLKAWHAGCAADGIPLYDFVYNRFSGARGPLDPAVQLLRDWPLDMIEWTVDNSRREDIVEDRTSGLDEGYLTRVLPRSEMGICGWDGEPYRAIIGNAGRREDKPLDWLLAYWMGRGYGFIGAPLRR